jgi:protein involved in polysaccharide export with SLBB domain
MRFSRASLAALALAAFLGGCAPMGERFDPYAEGGEAGGFQAVGDRPSLAPELLKPDAAPFRLGVGDVVDLEIAGIPDARETTFVTPDGKLYYNLAGGLKVEGLTLPEARATLVAALKRYYASAEVGITLKEVKSRRYWMLGNVSKPGLYPLVQPTTLLEAISAAGGIRTSRSTGTTIEMADLSHSFVVRGGVALPVDFEALVAQGDRSQDIYLRPGDYVYLPSVTSKEVFVLGAVRAPRAVGYSAGMGLVSAVANAGGLANNAYAQRVVIVRGSLSKPTVATINFNQVATGKQKDVRLATGDIVWVPNSPWERVERYVDAIIGTAARTIAANEGMRFAVGDRAGTVGTSISVGGATAPGGGVAVPAPSGGGD